MISITRNEAEDMAMRGMIKQEDVDWSLQYPVVPENQYALYRKLIAKTK